MSRNTRRIEAEVLGSCSVLVVANAVGPNESNDEAAFTESECDAIADWVAAGGALLLITDHYPVGSASENLAARFGVRLSKGVVEDSVQSDRTYDNSHLIFSRGNGGLADHPIAEGRQPSERIERVLTFTGEAVAADSPAVGFLRLSPTALARPATSTVERRGGDVLVKIDYGEPVAVPGWSQGLALEHGRGRVVVLGEAAMLTAQLRRLDRHPIGMNVPGCDNRQLALNIMHWLTRRL